MRRSFFLLFLLYAGISFGQSAPKGFIHIVYMKDTIFRKMDITQPNPKAYFAKVLQAASVCPISCSPLPVKWLSFKGERTNDSTCVLHWETSNEANNKGFDVERSLNNSAHFTKMGFVAAGTSSDPSLQYDFKDGNDFMGTSFYRLRQVDRDDKFDYSKVVAIKGYSKNETFEVYPNPAHNDVQLSVFLSKSGGAVVQLFDVTGRVIKQQDQRFAKGANLLNRNISELSAGAYIIRIITPAGKILSVRLIKK